MVRLVCAEQSENTAPSDDGGMWAKQGKHTLSGLVCLFPKSLVVST